MDSIREQIIGILLKNHKYLHYGMLMSASDLEGAREIANEITALLPTSKNYPHDYIRKNQDERKA